MNVARSALGMILFGSFVLFPTKDRGHVQDDQWKNLIRADRGQNYSFVTHELRCADGKIDAVTRQSVTLKRTDGTTVSIARQDLLRFGNQVVGSIGITYSGRSSWLDVKDLPHNPKTERGADLRVVMLDGKKHEGNLVGVQDTDLTLRDGRHSFQFARLEISQVYRLRYKPMSKSAQYANTELFVFKIFDPELWPYFFNVGTVSVLLYDSQLPEDDSAIYCKQSL